MNSNLLLLFVLGLLVYAALVEASEPLTFKLHSRLSRKLTTSITSKHLKLAAAGRGIPLQGNLTYWAEFFTTVSIGTPPQLFNLQVDTGSSDVIVYGSKCNSCPPDSPRYNAAASKEATIVGCHDHQFYCNTDICQLQCAFEDDFGGGNKIQGVVWWDSFTAIPGQKAGDLRVTVGQITKIAPKNLSFEPTGVDGLFGLAHKALSGWYGEPAIGLWMGALGLYDSFSMCLFQSNGVMEVGTNYYENNYKDYTWTEVQQVPAGDDDVYAWYVVWLNKWRIGGMDIGLGQYTLNENHVIVDSGTTLLVVPKGIWPYIQKAFLNLCSSFDMPGICGNPPNGSSLFNGDCIQLSPEQVAGFPNMTFSLYEATPLTIFPQDYLWQGAGVPGYYCLGIQAMGSDMPVILGDVFMQRFHVVFDRKEEMVGFGPLSTCPQI